MPGVAETPAGKSKRIYRVDETEVMYFGPRTPASVRKIAGWLHPPIAARGEPRPQRSDRRRARSLACSHRAARRWRSCASAGIGAFTFTPAQMCRYIGASGRAGSRRGVRRARAQRVLPASTAARADVRAHGRRARGFGNAHAGAVSKSDRRARARRHVGGRGVRRGAGVRARQRNDARVHDAARRARRAAARVRRRVRRDDARVPRRRRRSAR